ncbi:MAG TPA: nicotinate-nucleotide adenylyltransferase [Clostridia bacterium]|nr:nicotinate-nucleotide adenylyltransferase [Clostridia bacterium]
MRIGFLGGSFNPVHFGHIAIARQALFEFSLDKVLLIVAADPPHKEIAFHVSGEKRYEMLKCGLADETKIEASDIELKREGKSYTYDTVRLLKELYPDAELFCIVGADMLYDLPAWFKARELLQEVSFIGFARGGETRDISLAAQDLTEQYGAKVLLSEISGPELSSTEIRERVYSAKSVKAMLPDAAERYLYENGLYMPEEIRIKQEKLRYALNEERYTHSMGTVRAAIWLAERCNVDTQKARLAALLHDCAKVSKAQMRAYLERFQICPYAYAKNAPGILHGPVGAEVAHAEYGVEDPEVLLAIANHTVCSQGMGALEKIIYLADKIEPTRDYQGVTPIRAAAARSLNEGVLACMDHTIAYLMENKSEIDPCIYWAREYLLKHDIS